jgi:ankyrin repeat protein
VKTIASAFITLALSLTVSPGAENQAAGENRHRDAVQLIRQGDLPRIRELLTDRSVLDLRDDTGTPLIMYAALYLEADGLELFLPPRADANVTNKAGASALLWAATDLDKVRLLLRHGANANLASATKNTPLIVAALRHGSAPVLRELLAHGASVNASNDEGLNALIAAARIGDLDAVRLLLAHQADVGSAGTSQSTPRVVGTALMNAARGGHLDVVELLVQSGADIDANSAEGPASSWAAYADRRSCAEFLLRRGARIDLTGKALRSFRTDAGYTTLMYAAMTEQDDPSLVEALIAGRADVNAKSSKGETALDFAQKRGETRVVAALRRAGAVSGSSSSTYAATKLGRPDKPLPANEASLLRHSIETSLALQLESGARFTEASANRCFSCHSQSLPAVASRMAQERGLVVSQARMDEALRDTLRAASRRASERLESDFGTPLIASWFLVGLDAAGHKSDVLTDEYTFALARTQAREGQWISGTARPPSGYGDVTATALSIRALQRYAPLMKQREFSVRIQRAAQWLGQIKPRSTEERAMRLLGLHWAGRGKKELASLATDLLQSQRADGGWAQLATLESDSYATGQSLYALHVAGALSASDPRFQKGIQFLLATQQPDSSWFVPTRAFPLQRPMKEVFPHGEHQWSSMLGTTWATMALLCAIPAAAEPRVVTTR